MTNSKRSILMLHARVPFVICSAFNPPTSRLLFCLLFCTFILSRSNAQTGPNAELYRYKLIAMILRIRTILCVARFGGTNFACRTSDTVRPYPAPEAISIVPSLSVRPVSIALISLFSPQARLAPLPTCDPGTSAVGTGVLTATPSSLRLLILHVLLWCEAFVLSNQQAAQAMAGRQAKLVEREPSRRSSRWAPYLLGWVS